MSEAYRAVQWNRDKKRYDIILAAGVALYLAVFAGVSIGAHPHITAETLLIRGFGSAAILLLHVVLCIGPLARLDARFLPLLYNRRHLGVTLFLLALTHGVLATVQFHALGDVHPWVSILTGNPRYDSVSQFPFQVLGWLSLFVLFAMAATSHDFWLANLTAPTWKALHMSVYVAYVLLLLHVALGVLQSETQPIFAGLLALGAITVFGLHILAAIREVGEDGRPPEAADDGWVRLCRPQDIPEKRARIFPVAGERVAVFRYDGKVSALSNVCQHQNGPLGEGRIIDGCVTCPWHGFQYDPASGKSPAPFTEEVPTFAVEIRDGVVWLDPNPRPAGTPTPPAQIEEH
ncbi:MAG: Rieske 2Fe-2S domain-containing protein [Myxococcales bacterium]|nr:Rieske 2Fe-2S domain-containing protein [Myxococcales bacterium]